MLSICSQDIERKIKGYNCGTNVQKMTSNNPKLDPVNMKAYIKFGEILSNCSQDIELRRNYDGQNDRRTE